MGILHAPKRRLNPRNGASVSNREGIDHERAGSRRWTNGSLLANRLEEALRRMRKCDPGAPRRHAE